MMSGEEMKYPEWQAASQGTHAGIRSGKLFEKVQNVEMLILERLQVVFRRSDGRGEQVALAEALHTLRIIKRDKLGFPDWQ